MTYFKDISNILAEKYPNRNVYVISDQHFDHKNIIGLMRNDLFNGDNINDLVDQMNEHIIKEHNKVIGSDDIVLMLGDFSFNRSVDKLSNFVSRLNGHKFLVLGNHDNEDRINLYLRAGFEDVYRYPVQFDGNYYSHYPLNASINSQERPNTVLYNLMCKEFKDSSSGINYHGHQHNYVNNGDREKNVTCDQLLYKPLLVGKTKQKLDDIELPYINEEFFGIMHTIMRKYNSFQENSIIIDYFYTIFLELLSEYRDQIIVFGSYMLNKKYGTRFKTSDLDLTKFYDPNKSRKRNNKEMKLIADEIYEKMNKINGVHLDFYKKIDYICILSFIYASKNHNIKGFLDMNTILNEFYKSEDFITKEGISLLEYYSNKAGMDKPNTIRYPRFIVQTTNAFGDITNCFLQYIYTTDKEKRKTLLVKMEKIIKKLDFSSQEHFETLENMLIRYLLRNIYFFENANRNKETDIILYSQEIEIPDIIRSNHDLEDALNTIVRSDDYNKILRTIANSNDRKKEVTTILNDYKKQ